MNLCFLNNWSMAITFRVLAKTRSLFVIPLFSFDYTTLSFKVLWNVFVEDLNVQSFSLDMGSQTDSSDSSIPREINSCNKNCQLLHSLVSNHPSPGPSGSSGRNSGKLQSPVV